MKANEEQKKEIKEFFKLFYGIVINTYQTEAGEQYWNDLINACSYADKKLNSEMARALLISYCNWQDIRYAKLNGIEIENPFWENGENQ